MNEVWLVGHDLLNALHARLRASGFIIVDDEREFENGEVGCVIGAPSYRTYEAAARGLPVIEIVPKRRSLNWLSKWSNPAYRVIRGLFMNGSKIILTAEGGPDLAVLTELPRTRL